MRFFVISRTIEQMNKNAERVPSPSRPLSFVTCTSVHLMQTICQSHADYPVKVVRIVQK